LRRSASRSIIHIHCKDVRPDVVDGFLVEVDDAAGMPGHD
jgi:hypothetical protein